MRPGDVVLLNFPYSDLSGSKFRPAIVLAYAGRNDFVACQVTSNRDAEVNAIELLPGSFQTGSLRTTSFARPGKLFTAHRSLFSRRAGRLKGPVVDAVKQAVIDLVRQGK